MGEGLITDYQFRQLIERLRGIERELKHLNEGVRGDRRPAEPAPPEDPFGYTE